MKYYKDILTFLILPAAEKIMVTSISDYLIKIEKMNTWSRNQIKDWQNKMLKRIIEHAYENTEYYNKLFKNQGLIPEDICTMEDLKKIPILKKSDIINYKKQFIPKNIKEIKHLYSSTGGTSGDPLQFLLDYRSKSFTTASNIYNWNQKGYKYGEKHIALGSSSLFVAKSMLLKNRIYNKLRGRIPLNGVNLSSDIMQSYVELILRDKIKYIYGYASAVYLLAEFVKKNEIKVDHVKTCFTTSEILTESYRETIKKAFRCDILDCYGANDGGVVAYDLEPNYYHVGYNSLIEVHDLFQENTGKILCTDLLNYAMPFIRYELGDEVNLLPDELSDKYNGQVIRKIFGRVSDVFRLGNGRVLTGPGFTILFKDINVKAYRIELIDPFEIRVDIQKDKDFSKYDEKTILETFRKHAGDECKINLNFTDNMLGSNSGKIRYFYS